MTPVVGLHLVAALIALFTGVIVLLRPKGTPRHKMLGRIWVASMILVAVSSFWITGFHRTGEWSWIHGLSVWVLISMSVAVWNIRRGNIRAHQLWMIGTFIGLFVAGAFTLAPGRLIGGLFAGL